MRNIARHGAAGGDPPDQTQHGTSAAIEFAVRGLEVEHVVVLGHALCGGIAALVDGASSVFASYDYRLDLDGGGAERARPSRSTISPAGRARRSCAPSSRRPS